MFLWPQGQLSTCLRCCWVKGHLSPIHVAAWQVSNRENSFMLTMSWLVCPNLFQWDLFCCPVQARCRVCTPKCSSQWWARAALLPFWHQGQLSHWIRPWWAGEGHLSLKHATTWQMSNGESVPVLKTLGLSHPHPCQPNWFYCTAQVRYR